MSLAHAMFSAISPSNAAFTITGSLDVLLLLITLIVIGRTFGLVAALVCAVVFGANDFVMYGTNWGGATLRHDWLLCLGLGACALRRERFALGGALLGVSTMIRAFPALTLVGVGLAAAWREVLAYRQVQRLPTRGELLERQRDTLRVAAGAIGAALVAFVLARLVLPDASWIDWYKKVALGDAEPHPATLGLRVLLGGSEFNQASVLRARMPVYLARARPVRRRGGARVSRTPLRSRSAARARAGSGRVLAGAVLLAPRLLAAVARFRGSGTRRAAHGPQREVGGCRLAAARPLRGAIPGRPDHGLGAPFLRRERALVRHAGGSPFLARVRPPARLPEHRSGRGRVVNAGRVEALLTSGARELAQQFESEIGRQPSVDEALEILTYGVATLPDDAFSDLDPEGAWSFELRRSGAGKGAEDSSIAPRPERQPLRVRRRSCSARSWRERGARVEHGGVFGVARLRPEARARKRACCFP